MAIDKLGVYNDALTIIGERRLSSLTEDRPPRHRLDTIYDFGAVNYCLEVVKPRFACVTRTDPALAVPSDTGFNYQYTLPADYVALAGIFSNEDYSEAIRRYIVSGRAILTDSNPIYLRYISSTTGADFAIWTPTFAKVVSTYLAKELAPRSRPDLYEAASGLFEEAVKLAIDLNQVEEPMPRAKPPTATITPELLQVYNDALYIMGQPYLESENDTSENRAYLDQAYSQSVVMALLEDTDWYWAKTSTKIQLNPSLEPEWGYTFGFDKPDDMHRITGVFEDEFMQSPLKRYADEGDVLFCNLQEIYLEYIPDTLQDTVSAWPGYFRRLVAAELARKVAPMIEGADIKLVREEYQERRSAALSDDAMQNPPRKIANGLWVDARMRGDTYRQRP